MSISMSMSMSMSISVKLLQVVGDVGEYEPPECRDAAPLDSSRVAEPAANARDGVEPPPAAST